MIKNDTDIQSPSDPVVDNQGYLRPSSGLMTETELIQFLRIPEISKSNNYAHVIENLRRMHGLPCVHICRKPLYPLKNILEWIDQQCEKEKNR